MAQNVKEMLIRLNGEVGKGASQIGDTLTNIGNLLDIIGKKTRQFEIDSTNIYRDYEDQMLAAKFALSAQVESATELEKMMDGLDEAARKWASTSIFHTDDVSRAINEAAHAGWTYQEILEGIPEAMLIAQAGGMDLSNGLDYLIKMMNATRTPMDQMGTMIDQWAMAANISATNIDELGQAFMSMGAAAQFGDEPAELFAMLAALANVGTTGTKAGTALRSTIMRLIAPTTKAEAAMSLLGADVEELEEVLADENVTKAAKKLEGLGFSAFDAEGNLKPIMDIFSELFEMTDGMEEAAKDELLAAIFPTRTIATALSLLTASNGELDEMYDKIKNSKGYAQSGADIMMSGLTGSIETLLSKWEEFKRSIGETLAPFIEKAAEALGGLVDKLNSLPPEATEGIVSMLTALSTIGPLLIGVGAIAKLVGFLGPIGTLALIAGAGVSFLVGYLAKLDELNWDSKFGTLQADTQELGKYVDEIETKFNVEKQAITKYAEAVKEAQENYNNALTGMNEGLLKKVLTGGTFTDDDFSAFSEMGDRIVKATIDGIRSAEDSDMTLLQAMFGDKSTDKEAGVYKNTAELLDWYYGDLETEAYAIGENIRAQLTAALKNGELTADDRQAIQAQIDRLNKINAEIAARTQEQAYYTSLAKAGRVSWDSIETFLQDNEAKMKENLASIEEMYDKEEGSVMAAFARARATGQTSITYTDREGKEHTFSVTEEAEKAAREEINRERAASIAAEQAKFGKVSGTAFDTLMRDSDFGMAWNYMRDLYAKYGGVPLDAEGNVDIRKLGLSGYSDEELETLYNQMYGIFQNDSNWFGLGTGRLSKVLEAFKGYEGIDSMLAMLADDFGYLTSISDVQRERSYWDEQLLGKQEELDRATEALAKKKAARAAIDEETYNPNVYPYWATEEDWQTNQNAIKKQLDLEVDEAEKKVAEIEAEINSTKLQMEIALNTKAVDEYKPPKFSTFLYVNPTLRKGSAKDDLLGRLAEQTGEGFAEGGRATVPSIFGEAGAEWAIPEQHSERTARLLDAARRASGFTWGDLIARFGGLNANPGNSPVVLNYSPVINAADSRGVAGVLAQDKNRLVKMIQEALEEAKYRESVEVYA